MRTTILALLLAAAALPAAAAGCADGKTLEAGKLTLATGNPAYFPWVIDDKPESGQGFEAAVAVEMAKRMGFEGDAVAWVRTSFDEAIQPGEKPFDVNLQQYTITPERAESVDFSVPYYRPAQAIVVRKAAVDAGAQPTLASLKALRFGTVEGVVDSRLVPERIAPEAAIMAYNDVADATAAMGADQIDALMMDLPTALYTAAAVLPDGVVLGQFAPDASAGGNDLGMVLAKDSPLTACVNEALEAMRADGTLDKLEAEWLQTATGAPLIQ